MKPQLSLEEFRQTYGDWTAMSIHLGGDLYTLPPVPDGRLRRLVQLAADLSGKPLSQLRVLDLACLEGGYALEFAMQGAQAVGIEYREASIAKARFAKDWLGLERLSFFQDDVRNLSREKYGEFDLVICSGILYHLDAPDVVSLVRKIHEVCTRMAIFDTHVALHPSETVEIAKQAYHGVWYQEHDETEDQDAKLKKLWASVDNNRSFWPSQASLSNLIAQAGFTSFFECLNPHHELPDDRRCYVAMKGSAAKILSSPITAEMGLAPKSEAPPEKPPPQPEVALTEVSSKSLASRIRKLLRRA